MAAFFLGLVTTLPQAHEASSPSQDAPSELAHERVWHALLHLQHGQAQIADPAFLLSWPAFSAEAELQATLRLIHDAPATAACRFPARTLWLQSRMALPPMDTSDCTEIREFMEKAPFDRLELVFADESVTQPASVLGHSFLNIAGMRDGQEIEHAVSFYTHAETLHLPKLLWESLVSGKPGLFSLTPYALEERKYLEDEQRQLWRYEIRTSAFERALIRNHLFELKHSQLTYFFHQYNCATVLRNILSLTGDLPPSGRWWITPKDVVKDVQAAQRVAHVRASVADAWLVSNLAGGSAHPDDLRRQMLLARLAPDRLRADLSPAQRTGLRAYNRWLLHRGAVDEPAYEKNLRDLNLASAADTHVSLPLNASLEPSRSPGERHLRAQYSNLQPRWRLQWIPVSHTLMQSHDRASAETEMVLLSPVLAVDKNEKVRLDEFQIFSMKSLVPWNTFLRTWSTQTFIAYGHMTGHPLDRRGLHGSLQLGAMSRHGALDFYGLAGPGLHVQSYDAANAFFKTDVGALWRHGDSVKSRLSWTGWTGSALHARKIEFEQSWQQSPDALLSWKWSHVQALPSPRHSLSIALMRTF